MKTALDVDIELFKILDASAVLKSTITGRIYKGNRPDNSELEDISINTITLGDGSTQEGVSNVNIHVKDLTATIAGKTQNFANHARLVTLTNLIKPLLEETYGDDFNLWIEWTRSIPEPEIKQHYMNMRIRFRFDT